MTILKGKNGDFDFEKHREEAIKNYQKVRPLYEDFGEVIKSIVNESLKSLGIKVASLETRAKSIESFGKKTVEPSITDPTQPKYKSPLSEITDLTGVRIITFFPKTIGDIESVINSQFVVLEKSDKSEALRQEQRFGYQSVHYLVKLITNRITLPEYGRFKDLIAEIQVRTILQHAWAEIEHDIQYKSIQTIPLSIRRRFMALAGLLEIADREFQAVQDEDERLRQAARVSVREGRLEDVEITPDSLKEYLDSRLGSDGRMTFFSYDWTANMLRQMGFVNLGQINECIAGFDDDRISRITYGGRQGQLTRFEMLLLAGMGENYIEQHPWWADQDWFKKQRHIYLERIRECGIITRNYKPDLKTSLEKEGVNTV
jgi:putative GTP pyrophosphokinase